MNAFEKYMEKIIGMVLKNPDSEERDLLANRYRNILSEYRRLSAEQSQTPTEAGLRVEFPCPTCGAERFKTERNGDSWCRYGHKHPTKDFRRPASPTKADKVESLAELADRDEIEIEIKGPSVGWSSDTKWVIYFHCNEDTEFFTGETYQEAENLARAFLTGLDDVTGKGGREGMKLCKDCDYKKHGCVRRARGQVVLIKTDSACSFYKRIWWKFWRPK